MSRGRIIRILRYGIVSKVNDMITDLLLKNENSDRRIGQNYLINNYYWKGF
jgi:hypothetical protein